MQTLKTAGTWRPKYQQILEKVYKECQSVTCRARNETTRVSKTNLNPPLRFGQRVGIDLKIRHGKRDILYIVDLATGFCKATFINNKTPFECAKKFISCWYGAGFPRIQQVLSDNGNEFVADPFSSMLARMGTAHLTTPAHTPAFNGITERIHSLVDSNVKMLQEAEKLTDEQALAWAITAYNSCEHKSGYSAATLVFGNHEELPGIQELSPTQLQNEDNLPQTISSNLAAREMAVQNHQKLKLQQKFRHAILSKIIPDKDRKEVGQWVWVKRQGETDWHGPGQVAQSVGGNSTVKVGRSYLPCRNPGDLVELNKSEIDKFNKLIQTQKIEYQDQDIDGGQDLLSAAGSAVRNHGDEKHDESADVNFISQNEKFYSPRMTDSEISTATYYFQIRNQGMSSAELTGQNKNADSIQVRKNSNSQTNSDSQQAINNLCAQQSPPSSPKPLSPECTSPLCHRLDQVETNFSPVPLFQDAPLYSHRFRRTMEENQPQQQVGEGPSFQQRQQEVADDEVTTDDQISTDEQEFTHQGEQQLNQQQHPEQQDQRENRKRKAKDQAIKQMSVKKKQKVFNGKVPNDVSGIIHDSPAVMQVSPKPKRLPPTVPGFQLPEKGKEIEFLKDDGSWVSARMLGKSLKTHKLGNTSWYMVVFGDQSKRWSVDMSKITWRYPGHAVGAVPYQIGAQPDVQHGSQHAPPDHVNISTESNQAQHGAQDNDSSSIESNLAQLGSDNDNRVREQFTPLPDIETINLTEDESTVELSDDELAYLGVPPLPEEKRAEIGKVNLNYLVAEEIYHDVYSTLIPWAQHGTEECRKAKAKEFSTIQSFNTFEWVSSSALNDEQRQNIIGSIWVLVKKNVDGKTVVKARLCARGDCEKAKVRTDSPTCAKLNQKLLCSFAATKNWKIMSLDFTSAFIQGAPLERDLYMEPPRGFEKLDEQGNKMHMKLTKSLYGIRDAARAWYRELDAFLIKSGCTRTQLDRASYIYIKDGQLKGIIVAHVDDLLWCGEQDFMLQIVEKIKANYVVGRIDQPSLTFTGLDIGQEKDLVTASQASYLEKMKQSDYKHLHNLGLGQDEHQLLDEEGQAQFRSANGAIGWLAQVARPDLASAYTEFASKAGKATTKEAKKISRLLQTIHKNDYKIHFRPLGNLDELELEVYFDAAYNRNHLKDVIGEIILVKGSTGNYNVLHWGSHTLQPGANSSLAAEAEAGNKAFSSLEYVKQSLEDLFQVKVKKCTMYTDALNLKKAVESDTDIINDKRSRRPISILRDALGMGLFELKWVKSNFQLADILTKSSGNSQILKNVLINNKF